MPLQPGMRLGPYEILSALGAGGMGEVYKAKDTRLERTVAIKVLPPARAASPEVRQRFEREAKMISQLSHPHICAIYDVGRDGETDYLVIEYLEGETLAQRLAKGPLAIGQALQFGVEISSALDRAHRQGIVHRDLKPGNIMLTRSGVKLLDFGLAKTMPPAEAPGGMTALPTQANLTQEGTIIGTMHYMAPEQLEGKEADARTDIFAFGVVLHEMTTGRKAFAGATQASLISAILRDEPQPISQVQPMSPPALDRVVAICLAKDPEERWQSAHDLLRELRFIAEGASKAGARQQGAASSGVAARGPSARGLRTRLAGPIAGFAIGAVASGLGLWLALRPSPAPVAMEPVWLSMMLPADAPLSTYGSQRPVFTPDGSRVVWAASRGGTTVLYQRALGALEARPIRDSEGATSPFFSPDSRWLGFFAGSRIVKVPVDGGVAQPICDASEVRGAAWGPDGTIVFATGTSGLRRVPAAGGTAEVLLESNVGRSENAFYWPAFLPGGTSLLYTVFSGMPHVAVLSLKTGERHELIEGSDAQYAPSGHIVFGRGGSLFAAPFDAGRMELTGPAISIVEGVTVLSPFTITQFGMSRDGALVYAPGLPPRHSLVMVDRRGTIASLPYGRRGWEEPRFSPDGKRLAVAIREGDPDVWILELARGTVARLTFEAGEDETPVWSPDGTHVTYNSGRPGQPATVYRRPADGSGAEERLFESERHPHTGAWSPDDRVFIYTVYDPVTAGDIWTLAPGGAEPRHAWLQTPFNERAPRFSPDGRFVVYTSNESGRDEVYVQPFPGPGGKWQISTSGGAEPVWSRAGGEIFYRDGDRMMSARVATGGTLTVEVPHLLFEGAFVPTRRGEAAYDVTPDGQHFLMVRPDEHAVPTRLDVVLNFVSELARRAPAAPKP